MMTFSCFASYPLDDPFLFATEIKEGIFSLKCVVVNKISHSVWDVSKKKTNRHLKWGEGNIKLMAHLFQCFVLFLEIMWRWECGFGIIGNGHYTTVELLKGPDTKGYVVSPSGNTHACIRNARGDKT